MTITSITSIEGLKADSHSERVRNWLSPPDPSINLKKALGERHQGSGQWFLQSEAYSAWKMEPNSFLWLHGIPGCGKTILSSTVVKDLRDCKASIQSLLYFYFDFADTRKQSLEKAVRSLISQLYDKRENVRLHLKSLYSTCEDGKQEPSNDQLRTTFQNMVEQAGEVWIVLDALDECQTQKEHRTECLYSWIKHLRSSQTDIHLLVTSRSEQEIESTFERWARNKDIIHIQSKLVKGDICAYVHARVRENPELNRWTSSPEVQNEIEATLIDKANGM